MPYLPPKVPRRTSSKSLYLSKEEKTAIKKAAEKAGMAAGPWIREVMESRVRGLPDRIGVPATQMTFMVHEGEVAIYEALGHDEVVRRVLVHAGL